MSTAELACGTASGVVTRPVAVATRRASVGSGLSGNHEVHEGFLAADGGTLAAHSRAGIVDDAATGAGQGDSIALLDDAGEAQPMMDTLALSAAGRATCSEHGS